MNTTALRNSEPECERCGLPPSSHTGGHWCGKQSFRMSDGSVQLGATNLPLNTELDPEESNPIVLWAEIHRLRAAVKCPDGYETWQQAATAERHLRAKAERAASAADPDSWEENARHMLDDCPFTIRQRPGGGNEDLKSTLVVTFRAMQMRLAAAIAAATTTSMPQAEPAREVVSDVQDSRSGVKALTPDELDSCLPVSPLTKRPQVWFTKADVVKAIRNAEALWGAKV